MFNFDEIRFSDAEVYDVMSCRPTAGVENFTTLSLVQLHPLGAGLLGTEVISNWMCFISIC